jgi:hypothetical protein
MAGMCRRLLAVCACALVLASCKLDVAANMTMAPDGTGTVQVTATVDADVVKAAPTIAKELALTDVTAAGWQVAGPTATPEGGLTLTISHSFSSADEATNLLNSIGPPFNEMKVTRSTVNKETTTGVSGLLGLSNGFNSFADQDLVTAVGSLPFGDQIAASGATPATSMTATFNVTLPGRLKAADTNGKRLADGSVQWTAPLDGQVANIRASSVQAPGNNDWWARPLSIVALVALVGWVLFMTLFIGYVVWARSRRSRAYRDRPHPTG